MSSAEFSCKLFKPIFAYWQTVWTLIRLLLKEQSDLGPRCLQKWLLKSQADDKADDNSCDWRFKGKGLVEPVSYPAHFSWAGLVLYCLFNITRKDVFRLAFYLKWKYFVLNDHILSETICLFCFCVLFSNMYPKIKFLWPKIVLTNAISTVKWIFGFFV